MKKTLVLAAAFAAAALMSTASIAASSPNKWHDPGGIPTAQATQSTQSSASVFVIKAEPGAVQAVAVKDLNPLFMTQLAKSAPFGGEGMGGPVRVGAFGPGGGDDPSERPMARSRGGDGADGTFAASPGTSPVPALHQRT